MARDKFIVAVHLFLRRNNEILLLRRFNTGYEDGNYSVVAGHLESGEDVYSAMIREAKEEIDISINKENLTAVHVMHRKKGERECIDYFFECNVWFGNIENKEPDKCDELKWFDVDNLPCNMIDYVDEVIGFYENGEHFSIYGWESCYNKIVSKSIIL